MSFPFVFSLKTSSWLTCSTINILDIFLYNRISVARISVRKLSSIHFHIRGFILLIYLVAHVPKEIFLFPNAIFIIWKASFAIYTYFRILGARIFVVFSNTSQIVKIMYLFQSEVSKLLTISIVPLANDQTLFFFLQLTFHLCFTLPIYSINRSSCTLFFMATILTNKRQLLLENQNTDLKT